MRYVLEFGIYEYRLYELELEIDKLKRKIQLIQIEINHGNEIDLEKINQKLDEEFEEYFCDVDMDEDDMARLISGRYRECPFWKNGDEYDTVKHQM